MPLRITHQRHRQVCPHGLAVFAEEWLLQLKVVALSVDKLLVELPNRLQIVRVHEFGDNSMTQLLRAVAQQILQRAIRLQDESIDATDADADGGGLENGPKTCFALAQRLFDL